MEDKIIFLVKLKKYMLTFNSFDTKVIMIITIYKSGELETRYPTTVKVVVLCLCGEYIHLLVCKMIHFLWEIAHGILFSGKKES